MKSLVLMYVYYDLNGDIKAITPSPDLNFASQFETATFPVDEVIGFLNAQQNPFDYIVRAFVNTDGIINRKIIRKEVKTVTYRSLDTYLTKVKENSKNSVISIRNNLRHKIISVVIKDDFSNDSEVDQDDIRGLLLMPELTLYFTKHNNPYHLLHTVKFHPQAAYMEGTSFNYKMDLVNVSVYTKKAFDSYGYYEEGKR